MKDKDLNIDIDIDMKIYKMSNLSYVIRLKDRARTIKEKITIQYSKEAAAKKARQILQEWLDEQENEKSARS